MPGPAKKPAAKKGIAANPLVAKVAAAAVDRAVAILANPHALAGGVIHIKEAVGPLKPEKPESRIERQLATVERTLRTPVVATHAQCRAWTTEVTVLRAKLGVVTHMVGPQRKKGLKELQVRTDKLLGAVNNFDAARDE